MPRPLLIPLLLTPLCACAQQLELSGGVSSLYQAAGGQLSLQSENLQASVGAGLLAGHPVAGAHLDLHRQSLTYTGGIVEQQLNLPTDLFNNAHRLVALGLGIAASTRATKIHALLGLTSTRFDTPLFQGASPQSPIAAIQWLTPLTPRLQIHAQLIATSSFTALAALAWQPRASLALAVTAGLGNRAHYAAASLDFTGASLQLKATASTLGRGFVRIGGDPAILPEPIRENLAFSFRPHPGSPFSLSGAHQNFLIAPFSTGPANLPLPATASAIDQLSAATTLRGTGLNASVFRSSFGAAQSTAIALSASRPLVRRLQTGINLYQNWSAGPSGPSGSRLIVANLQQTLTNRISLTQNITRAATAGSGGQTSANFGGSLLTSFATLSAAWQTFYVPTQPTRPFQQSLILEMQLNLFGRLNLHGSTFVSPLGKLLYTADARATGVHSPTGTPAAHSRLDNAILRGRVVDPFGAPIAGTPIQLDHDVLFTDSEGQFFLRERKPHAHPLSIPLDQFLDGRNYRVVSAPRMILSERQPAPTPIIIVVQLAEPALQPR